MLRINLSLNSLNGIPLSFTIFSASLKFLRLIGTTINLLSSRSSLSLFAINLSLKPSFFKTRIYSISTIDGIRTKDALGKRSFTSSWKSESSIVS